MYQKAAKGLGRKAQTNPFKAQSTRYQVKIHIRPTKSPQGGKAPNPLGEMDG